MGFLFWDIRMKPFHFISWLAVISIFIVTGLLLYSGFSSLELQEPSEASSLKTTIDDIKRLDTSYAEAIESKAKYQDIWSLVALFAAAAGAGAVALRAPQVVIITVGTFLAIVYGSLELQSPQTIISSLAKARSSLSCIESPTRQLMVAKDKYLNKVSNLINNLEPYLKTLGNYSVELDLYLGRLDEVLKIKEGERKKALESIDNALMLPVEDNQSAINEIQAHLVELGRLKNFITYNTKPETNQSSRQMLQKLSSIHSLLEDARELLQMPERLQSELSYGSRAYSEQLVKSAKVQKAAHDQLDKTRMALSKLVPALTILKAWPQNIEIASVSANHAVKSVHRILLAELAQAGPTQARLTKVISGLNVQIPTSLEKLKEKIAPLVSEELKITEDLQTAGDKVFINNLQEAVAILDSKSRATLNKLESKIARARDLTKRLEKISDIYLTVLKKATELFDDKTRTLNSTIESYGSDLTDTLRLLGEAAQVIDQVDFGKINLKIESCVKLSQRSP
jgi:hypothetical protein